MKFLFSRLKWIQNLVKFQMKLIIPKKKILKVTINIKIMKYILSYTSKNKNCWTNFPSTNIKESVVIFFSQSQASFAANDKNYNRKKKQFFNLVKYRGFCSFSPFPVREFLNKNKCKGFLTTNARFAKFEITFNIYFAIICLEAWRNKKKKFCLKKKKNFQVRNYILICKEVDNVNRIAYGFYTK